MLKHMFCCGVHEINGIATRTPMDSLKSIYEHSLYRDPYARGGFLIFTARYGIGADGIEFKYGDNFKQYISDNGLGNVVESSPRNNYRYIYGGQKEHLLKVYVWEVNHDTFKEWYDKNFPIPR